MEISYTTKKKSKEEQQEKFLKLDPAGRFQSFLALMETISLFGVKENDSNKMRSEERRVGKECER